MSSATAGYGTQLKIAGTLVAEVTNISFGGVSLEVTDVTHMASTGAFREKLATLLDAGDVTFDINFQPVSATHGDASGGLIHAMVNRALTAFTVIWTDAGPTTWSFNAYVTNVSPQAPVDGKLSASVTLSISGQPDFSA